MKDHPTPEPVRACPEPPIHPFEVRISIGGEDWDYVLREMERLERRFRENEPGACPSFGGGGGGSYSVTVALRDVTPDQFRRELALWFDAQRAEHPAPAQGAAEPSEGVREPYVICGHNNFANRCPMCHDAEIRNLAEQNAALRARLEQLQDAISPSRSGMANKDYYLGVVARMREKQTVIRTMEQREKDELTKPLHVKIEQQEAELQSLREPQLCGHPREAIIATDTVPSGPACLFCEHLQLREELQTLRGALEELKEREQHLTAAWFTAEGVDIDGELRPTREKLFQRVVELERLKVELTECSRDCRHANTQLEIFMDIADEENHELFEAGISASAVIQSRLIELKGQLTAAEGRASFTDGELARLIAALPCKEQSCECSGYELAQKLRALQSSGPEREAEADGV